MTDLTDMKSRDITVGIAALEPERKKTLNGTNGHLRLQSPSYKSSVVQPHPSSFAAECKGKAEVHCGVLPRSKSQPVQYTQHLSSQALAKIQHVSAVDSNVERANELAQICNLNASAREKVNSKAFSGNTGTKSDYPYIYSKGTQIDDKSSRPLSEILQYYQETGDSDASCLACKELRCPKTCTNWKAHCLQRSRKFSAPPLSNTFFQQLISSTSLHSLPDTRLSFWGNNLEEACHFASLTPQTLIPKEQNLPHQGLYQPVTSTYGNHVRIGQSSEDVQCRPNRSFDTVSSPSFTGKKSPYIGSANASKPFLNQSPSSSLLCTSYPCQLKSSPSSLTSSLLTQSDQTGTKEQAELSNSREYCWSSFRGNMAKGYVRALAEQLNHHGPSDGTSGAEEEEDSGNVSVQSLVKKLNQSNTETEPQKSVSNGKQYTSNVAQNSGALSSGALKGDLYSSQMKNELLQSLVKAADKKKQSASKSPSPQKTSPGHVSSSPFHANDHPRVSPASQQKLGKHTIERSHSSTHNSSENLNLPTSYLSRKNSEPPPWSDALKPERQSPESRTKGSPPHSKPSLKPKPAVDYSRKPSLDLAKKPAISLKRPSLPSQDISSAQFGLKTKLSVFTRSESASSSLSSPPSSPSLDIICQSSQDSIYQNLEQISELDANSSEIKTTDNEVFYPQACSQTSATPQISVTPVVGNVQESCSDVPDSKTSNHDADTVPSLRLRSAPGRSNAVSEYRESVLKTIYDNGPPLNVAELFDSSWSDSDSFSNDYGGELEEGEEEEKAADTTIIDSKDSSHEEEPDSETPVPSPGVKTEEERKAELESKRKHIVQEMLKTERDYVARLHLLHHVFFFRLDKENRQQTFLPAETLEHIFSNTKSIYSFHHDFLLQQMEAKVEKWDQDPRIGDMMRKNAPFLIMYSQYIANFDNAMKLIDQWTKKSPKFSSIIKAVQELPECGSLSLQHHMLEPIQRVPRYEMLIRDYVKTLPEDSPDLVDAKAALELVTRAACHSNTAMKKIELFRKLLDIYQTLKGVPLDFISPTREFVTQGQVTKIAARSGEKMPRHLFLFNDLILVCNQYNPLLGTYNVRSQLEMDSLEIKPGNNMNISNTFRVHSKQKAVELLDEDHNGSSFSWEEKITHQLALYKQKKRSIVQEEGRDIVYETSMPDSWVGKTAPVWIPDDAATMCMLCQQPFNMMRRRHHCRACGKLICRSCSNKKAPLQYMKGKIERVCAVCYDVIVNKQPASGSDLLDKKKGLLQVKASEPSLMSGYVQCSEDNGNSWHRMWIAAHKDFVLYSFKAHEDVSAISCRPLPGHEVKQVWDQEGRPHVFSLMHKQRIVSFIQPQNDKQLKRWISVVGKLVQAELPDENQRQSTNSNNSNTSSEGESCDRGCEGATILTTTSTSNTTITSSNSGSSQADSGFPGDDAGGGSGPDPDQDGDHDHLSLVSPDHEEADKISQYDNVDAVIS